MKVSIEINAGIEKVFDLFTDKSRFGDWKIGFVNYEQMGSTGERTKLNYKKFVLIETVLSKKKPNEYIAAYEHLQNNRTMMTHRARNTFTRQGENRTLVEVESEITEVNNFMVQIMTNLFAGAGKKQLANQMQLFKKIVEKE